ncbi:MAG TPA: BlaI/MecI/CopY family transcriptional regulator [Candidatus Binatia bacterium]|nr:BlaI/MecI/CopY family transcriptional regulator [Candidatus Binatia bacterium]
MRRFSKRESEILDALYRIREGSVADVVAALDSPPSYDSIRTTLRILEEKGAVTHRREDRRFVYAPKITERKAWQSTARRLADVFFGGSIERAALAMLKTSDAALSEEEIERLERKLARAERAAKKDGKQ